MIKGDPEFIEAIVHANGREICTECPTVSCVQNGEEILQANKAWEIQKRVDGRVEQCLEGQYNPEYL